jgi:ABC-type branched-subunit amino acid transport system substrate-binding protein
MRIRPITWAAAMTLIALTAPAGAIPILDPGTPSVVVWTNPGDDAFTWVLHAEAHDPDGTIKSISICVDEAADPEACHVENFTEPPTPLQEVERCLGGKAEDFHIAHRFTDYGIHKVVATVTAGGCPVIGQDEQAQNFTTVSIVRPGEPIPCSQPGTPAATDVGVTETTVDLGATVALSGPMSNVTAAGLKGINAALRDVNAAGGVCSRYLQLTFSDDGLDPDRGRLAIQRLIDDGAFALVAMPSGPGLAAAISDGTIGNGGIPVVGTGAQSEIEFTNPWVWPVAPSHSIFGGVAVRHAYESGSRSFALVRDDLVGGVEVRDGIAAALPALTDATLAADRRISLSEPSFESVISDLDNQCRRTVGAVCDALIVAVDTTNVVKFFQAAQRLGRKFAGTEITPWAFNDIAVRDAPYVEDGFGWTGFLPPIAPANAAAARYAELIALYYGNVDTKNPIMEGVHRHPAPRSRHGPGWREPYARSVAVRARHGIVRPRPDRRPAFLERRSPCEPFPSRLQGCRGIGRPR